MVTMIIAVIIAPAIVVMQFHKVGECHRFIFTDVFYIMMNHEWKLQQLGKRVASSQKDENVCSLPQHKRVAI